MSMVITGLYPMVFLSSLKKSSMINAYGFWGVTLSVDLVMKEQFIVEDWK